MPRLLAAFKVDFAPARIQPSWRRLAATVVSIAGSLAADALLVALGTRVFPSTKGYVHFQFRDYARLTVVGVVVVACLAWPVVTRISSAPQWLFFRMAIVVTLVLLLPDLWILAHGTPGEAVVVLMCLHLAIALVTYNALVNLAPAGGDAEEGRH